MDHRRRVRGRAIIILARALRGNATTRPPQASWVAEAAVLARDASAATPLLHAKCAEALMLWTHHMPAAAKEALVHEQGVTLPTLEPYNASHAAHGEPAIAEVYDSSYTCQTGHGMTEATTNGSDHVLPHWPTNVHYTGTGYEAYPFW